MADLFETPEELNATALNYALRHANNANVPPEQILRVAKQYKDFIEDNVDASDSGDVEVLKSNEEYGVRYLDGSEHWDYLGDIETHSGRNKFLERYRKTLAGSGIPDDAAASVVFLRRTIRVTASDVVEIEHQEVPAF